MRPVDAGEDDPVALASRLVTRTGWGFLPLPGERAALRRAAARSARRLAELAAEPVPDRASEEAAGGPPQDVQSGGTVVSLDDRRALSRPLRTDLTWRRIAGPSDLEPAVARIDTPAEIVAATGGTVGERLRVVLDGPPSGFTGAVVTLEVREGFTGRLDVVDSTDAAHPMRLDEGSLVAVLPGRALDRRPTPQEADVYDAVFRLAWTPAR